MFGYNFRLNFCRVLSQTFLNSAFVCFHFGFFLFSCAFLARNWSVIGKFLRLLMFFWTSEGRPSGFFGVVFFIFGLGFGLEPTLLWYFWLLGLGIYLFGTGNMKFILSIVGAVFSDIGWTLVISLLEWFFLRLELFVDLWMHLLAL